MSILRKYSLVVTLAATLLAGCLAGGAVFYRLTEQHRKQLEGLTGRHSQQMESLRSRLRSISRRVGNRTLYLDVTRVPVSGDQLAVVSQGSQFFPELGLYTRIPQKPAWEYSMISEDEFVTLAVPQARADENLSDLTRDVPLHLWRDPETYRLKTVEVARQAGIKEVHFFSYLVAQKFEYKAFLEGLQFVAVGEKRAERAEARLGRLLMQLDRSLQQSGETEDPALVSEKRDPVSEQKKEILRTLENLYQPQAISMSLTGLISSSYRLSQILPRSSFQVESFQQKGNVLYVKTKLSVDKPELTDQASVKRFAWNREYLFFSRVKEFVLIHISFPHIDGKGEGGHWATQWLSHLYIPVSAPTS